MNNQDRKISSLRDLARDIAPPRDLWQDIEARIAAESGANHAAGGIGSHPRRLQRKRLQAAVAVIAALAVGIWFGRAVPPHRGALARLPVSVSSLGTQSDFLGAKYLEQRQQLLKDLQARIEALPPDSRAKVIASLKTINDCEHELEVALGKDPSNALLQELLVNTYQDEMRVLTTVHEAGRSGEGI